MKVVFITSSDFNLGVAYVIAYLKSIGHEITLLFDKEIDHDIFKIITLKPDLICFSCVTANIGWALHKAKTIKLLYRARILFGGVHPSLCPEDITKEGFEVCIGDGIAYFGGIFNPDTLFPDREIFLSKLTPVHRSHQIFMTGFGCPFRCSYCNSHNLQKKIIRRNANSCIQELKQLKEKGLKYVLFVDDIFILNKVWIMDFLAQYKLHVGLPFTCFGHVKYITDEICKLLKGSCCDALWIGIQSGNENTRKEILNRNETNDAISRACKTIKQNKLKLMIDHIFGLPQDTYEKLEESYFFYKSLKPDVVDCNELLYFPKADINKYGVPEKRAMYEKQGGQDFKRYAKSFQSIPLVVN